MVIISMLLAMGIFIFVIIGLVILLVGIILDIICIAKKIKIKQANVILVIFAILFTVVGLLMSVIPIVLLKVSNRVDKIKENKYKEELLKYNEDDIVRFSDPLFLDEGFDYHGIHYVECADLHTPSEDDEIPKEDIGAIEYKNGKHTILYKIPNGYSENLIFLGSGVYCPESELEEVRDYYYNKAPLNGRISLNGEKTVVDSSELDSKTVREIRDILLQNGKKEYDDNDVYLSGAEEGYIIFNTDDNLFTFSIEFKMTDESVEGEYNGRHMILSEEYEDYIRKLIEK